MQSSKSVVRCERLFPKSYAGGHICASTLYKSALPAYRDVPTMTTLIKRGSSVAFDEAVYDLVVYTNDSDFGFESIPRFLFFYCHHCHHRRSHTHSQDATGPWQTVVRQPRNRHYRRPHRHRHCSQTAPNLNSDDDADQRWQLLTPIYDVVVMISLNLFFSQQFLFPSWKRQQQ